VFLLCAFAAVRPCPLVSQIDPTGSWRTLETEHFHIHLREEYRALGERVAGEAEAAYAGLARILPSPRRAIELVVADNVDEANGYATTYPLPRIVIYALPPAGDLQLESYDRWLRFVITHELTHVFHLDLARGIWDLGRTVLGRAPFLFPNDYTPPWMREGLAVFYESRLTGAGRLESAWHRALVGAAAAEQGAMGIGAASTASPKWPGGLKPYAFGATFFGAQAAAHGDSAIARFAVSSAGKLLPYLELSRAFRAATGVTLGGAWRAWQEEPRAPRRGRADEAGAHVAPQARAVLGGLWVAVPPRVSPDGRSLALVRSDGTDAERLVVVDLTSLARRVVARLNAANGVAWTPQGDVVVSQLEYADPYTLRADLWRISPEGRSVRLTRGERLREPDVAADGAIVAVRAVPGGTALVLLESDGRPGDPSALRTIARSEDGVEWASPRFAPDGRRIAAVRVRGGWHDIVLLSREGGEVRAVTGDSVPDLMPAFSPDGRWLVWSREVQGTPQIVGLRLDADSAGSEGRQFTAEPFAAYAPAPAGDSLYYLAYHADGFRLVAAPFGGTPWAAPVPDSVWPRARAPASVVRAEHSYRALASVLPRYWVPEVFALEGGAWFGALTTGEDVLGRHAYVASLQAGVGTFAGRWRGNLTWVYAGAAHALLDLGVGHHPTGYPSARFTNGGAATFAWACCDVDDAADAGITFVKRRWRWQGRLRLGTEYTRDAAAERVGGSVTASVARLVQPALAISTQDGGRLSVTVRYRRRTNGSLDATEVTARGAAFQSFGSRAFARAVLAARVSLGAVGGRDPVVFDVGGVTSGAFELIPGLSYGGAARTFPVRGFDPGTLAGRRAATASLEHRVPLALIAGGPGLLPLGLDRLSASVFVDGGAAWLPQYCAGSAPSGPVVGVPLCARTLLSAGAELSADLVLGYDFPMRLRIGAALRVAGANGAGAYASIGAAF
jgi:hypothetical protein